MLVHMALDEEGVLLRVQAAGDVLRQLGDGTPPKVGGCLPDRNAVQVGHKVVAVKLLCKGGPVLHRAQVVAQVQVTGGLNAGQHYLLSFCLLIHLIISPFQNCSRKECPIPLPGNQFIVAE